MNFSKFTKYTNVMAYRKIQLVEEYVHGLMNKETAHDFKHVDRVRNWVLRIAAQEDFADLTTVEIAALMHDIGLGYAKKRSEHGEVGAKMADLFLTKNKVLPAKKIKDVCEAIKSHCHNQPVTEKLSQILRDADILDLLGAAGIMRAYSSQATKPEYNPANIKGETWQMSASDFDQRFKNGIGIGDYIIDHLNFQISCYDNMSTPTAKKLAKPLIGLMKKFIIQLDKEINSNSI